MMRDSSATRLRRPHSATTRLPAPPPPLLLLAPPAADAAAAAATTAAPASSGLATAPSQALRLAPYGCWWRNDSSGCRCDAPLPARHRAQSRAGKRGARQRSMLVHSWPAGRNSSTSASSTCTCRCAARTCRCRRRGRASHHPAPLRRQLHRHRQLVGEAEAGTKGVAFVDEHAQPVHLAHRTAAHTVNG